MWVSSMTRTAFSEKDGEERRSEYYSMRGGFGKEELTYLAVERMKSSPSSHCN